MKVTLKQVEQALIKANGFQSVAAEMLGVHPSSISRRLKNNANLQKRLDEIQEARLDFAEQQLEALINDKNPSAIMFFLKCKGKKRGYIEKEIHIVQEKKNSIEISGISEDEASNVYRDFMND